MRARQKQREGKPVPSTFGEATAYSIGRGGEKRTKKALGARLTTGSGNGSTKGDLMHGTASGRSAPRGYRRMVEQKTTQAKSMKLECSWLEKLSKEAFAAKKEPVLVIEFEGVGAWAMVPLEKMKELFELEDGE